MMQKVDSAELTRQLKQYAHQLGFNLVGVVPAHPSPQLHSYLRWIDEGMHGEMGYMARPDRVQRRQDLNVILPNIQSIVCVGLDYHTPSLPNSILKDPSRGRISSYAYGQDYHHVMTPRLKELGNWLASVTDSAVSQKVYVDTGAILERSHANLAGLGFTGKNTMLINPRRGSFFFLGELLTTLSLVPDPISPSMPSCGSCTRCLQICPTNAFPEPYRLDARRCISYLTIEYKGIIPLDLRPMMGNWIYGCDLCQLVCPFNRFAPYSAEVAFDSADLTIKSPFLIDLVTLSKEQFVNLFQHTPIKRLSYAQMLRNVAVAMGNWQSEHAVPSLIKLLINSDPLVRSHAAWAIGVGKSEQGLHALRHALDHELNSIVREEINLALK